MASHEVIEAALVLVEQAKPVGLPTSSWRVEPREFLALCRALDDHLGGLRAEVKDRAHVEGEGEVISLEGRR